MKSLKILNIIQLYLHNKDQQEETLKGLPQFDNEDFGRGKRRRVPTSRTSAAIVDAEEPLDVEEVIDAEEAPNQKGRRLIKGEMMSSCGGMKLKQRWR